jgi:hypothetical protein
VRGRDSSAWNPGLFWLVCERFKDLQNLGPAQLSACEGVILSNKQQNNCQHKNSYLHNNAFSFINLLEFTHPRKTCYGSN